MIQIYPNLFVGKDSDYERDVKNQEAWAIVHACKEPYHRQALGYKGQGAPKKHPEYLIARRENRLILNLINAPSSKMIPSQIIDAALDFIDENLKSGKRVLVHSNQGGSRSPTIGLLYLASHTDTIPCATLTDAEAAFRQLYAGYKPNRGLRGFLASNWDKYCKQRNEPND